MTVSGQLMANGRWDVTLSPETPRALINGLAWLSTVIITDAHVNEDILADTPLHPAAELYPATTLYPPGQTLMGLARFAGVLTRSGSNGIGGFGLAWWLGTDDIGEPIESTLAFGGVGLPQVIPHLLPQAIAPGTLYDTQDVFVGTVGRFQFPRPALDYLSQVMRTEWRVNSDGTLDAGTESQLFTDQGLLPYPRETAYPDTTLYPDSVIPTAMIVAKAYEGVDVDIQTLGAEITVDMDVESYANRALVIAEGEGSSVVTASAEVTTTLKDPHGNLVRLTKLVSAPDTDASNAAQQAAVEVTSASTTRTAVQLSVRDYYITTPSGDAPRSASVGTTVYVYDPDEGLFDTANPVQWRGQTVYPVALRVLGNSWPVTSEHGVYVRNTDGTWEDLTPYIRPETGDATLEVGATRRTLLNLTKQREAFRARVT